MTSILLSAAIVANAWPLTTLRVSCKTDEEFHQIVDITRRNKGSFDEFWMAYNHPWQGDAKVRQRLEQGAVRSRIAQEAGIRPGEQQGMTLGHGSPLIGGNLKADADRLDIPDDAFAVGRDGQRLDDFCPRSPFVLAREEWYVEQLCRIQHPVSLWLDDDLRNGIWKPDACFCDRCLAAFNAETSNRVTRAELVSRLFGVGEVDAIRGAWFRFNARSLALFAAAARRGANKVDPSLPLCLQACSAAYFYSGIDRRDALWELSDHGRVQTGIRCGSGYFTEILPPRDLIRRLQHVMREAVRCRAYGDWMGSISYENDTYTHQVLNKTWEASLKENALALAAGCDAVTMYWYDSWRQEPMELFDEFAEHLAAWRPYFKRLSDVSKRTRPGGVARKLSEGFENILPGALRSEAGRKGKSLAVAYSFEHPMDLQLALYGLPITVAEAKPQAWYTSADRWVGKGHQNNPTTAELEQLRDLFDARAEGGLPVRIGKAQPLIVWPRVDAQGRLVAVSFFNCSLGAATKVPVRLRRPIGTRLTWMAGEVAPRDIPSQPGTLPEELIVTLPTIPGFDLGTLFVEDNHAATLFFAGDSTLDDHHRSAKPGPYASWGTMLARDMLPSNRVVNVAQSGASTRSFIADGYWNELISAVRPGDFVAIQFGHNDQKRSDEHYLKTRWADPRTTFREIVRDWVAQIRAKGATPILLSPICRATFDADGKKLIDVTHASPGVCLASYRDAMHELSVELKCDYVDMNALTHDLFVRLGSHETRKFFVASLGIKRSKDGEPVEDLTHPIARGAEAMAQLFLEDVRRQNLSVARLFRDPKKQQ